MHARSSNHPFRQSSHNPIIFPVHAVVTISTPTFIPGTLVMVHSFLKYNPWFEGDFIVLTDEVTEEMEKHLTHYPQLKFRIIGDQLLENSRAVAEADETGRIYESHFYSLELFNIQGYDKLFYVDSDMLILGSFEELFAMEDKMICVGDGVFYKDELRNGASYEKRQPKLWERKGKFWGDNFNAGLILFDGSMANEKHYRELTDMVTTEGYSTEAMRLQDQMMQNIYFRGQYTLVSAKYNYRMGIQEQILEKDGVTMEDAVVIHYTARRKPWFPEEALVRVKRDADYFRAFELWQQHWIEVMRKLHETAHS